MVLKPRKEDAGNWWILKCSRGPCFISLSSVTPETILHRYFSCFLHLIVIVRLSWDVNQSGWYLSCFNLCFVNVRRRYELLWRSLIFFTLIRTFCSVFHRLIDWFVLTSGCTSSSFNWYRCLCACESSLKCVRICRLRWFLLKAVVLDGICRWVSLVQ